MAFTSVNDPAGAYTVPARAERAFPNSFHFYLHCEWLPGRQDGRPNFLVARRLPYDAAAQQFPGPDETHDQGALVNPEKWERVTRVDNFDSLGEQYPVVAQIMDLIHTSMTAIEGLQLLAPQVAAAQAALATLTGQQTAAQSAYDAALAAQPAAVQALTDAQIALEALPAEASEEDRAAALVAVDAAQAEVDRLIAVLADQTAALTALAPQVTAAQATLAGLAGQVAALEAQLGKQ